MKRLAVAFSGPSNSGKTTLIEKISKKLSPSQKIAIIKHDPKDKAIFDVEGKDSDKFFKSGANVAVLSPTRTTLFNHSPSTIDETIELFGDFNLLMVEGLKTFSLPRISIFRGKVDENYLDVSDAIAIDDTIKTPPNGIEVLDLNDIDMIIEWIYKNAKRV